MSVEKTEMSDSSYRFRIRKGILAAAMAVVLVASFLTGSLPAAYAQTTPTLFAAAGGSDSAADHARGVMRSRYVTVDMRPLLNADGSPRAVSSLSAITLNLFDNATYAGVVKSVYKGALGSTNWVGTLSDVPGGYFYLVSVDGAFIAHVASTQGIYEVSYASPNVYRVVQLDQSQFVDEPAGWNPQGGATPVADVSANADPASRIDVMVVYTAAALAGEGSLPAMKARIALAITETNQGYANAGVTPRLRLVHIEKVSYTESGDIQTDVNREQNPSDGFMDNIHSLRNVYGADMVSLIVENGGGYCGIAYTIMATASQAFDVVQRNGCMTGYYSFGHEFGHLQGARHDVYVDPTNTPYAYGHGYVHTSTSASNRWRTIMAYDNKCNAAGYSCTRLQYWSNNTKTAPSPYSGTMGAANAHNYTVLNNTASTVANFRTQVIASDFNSSFNGSTSGWSAVTGTWTDASGAYYYSHGAPATNGHSAKRAGKFGDMTYEVRMSRGPGSSTSANRVIIRGNPAHLVSTKWWSPSYTFQYSNDGYFSVYYTSATGTITALKSWTTSAAIHTGYSWNTLKVVAVGSSLKFYINGTLVWSGSSSALRTGTVGVGYYADTTSDWLYVDWAKNATTPTADLNPNADVAPGVEVPGGDFNHSPGVPGLDLPAGDPSHAP
jgi:hypothetical protein